MRCVQLICTLFEWTNWIARVIGWSVGAPLRTTKGASGVWCWANWWFLFSHCYLPIPKNLIIDLKIHKIFSEQTRCPTEIINYGATRIGNFFFGAKLMRLVHHHPFANEESVNLLPLARTIDFETKPSSITIVNENRFVITGLDVRCKSFSIYFTTDGLYLASTWCLSQKMMDNWWVEFGQMKLSFAGNCM